MGRYIRSEWRLVATYIFAATVLTGVIVSVIVGVDYPSKEWREEVRGKHQTDELIFSELRKFMLQGPRNTAQQGEDLCVRISVLEGSTESEARVLCHMQYILDPPGAGIPPDYNAVTGSENNARQD